MTINERVSPKRLAEIIARAEVCDDSLLTDYRDIESMARELQQYRAAAEPVAYMIGGHYLMHAKDPKVDNYTSAVPLYTRPQPAPVVVDFNKLARELVENLVDCNGADDSAIKQYQKWAEKTCRAAMLNGGKS